MKSISSPIIGISNIHEQRVLAVLGQLSKVLPEWREAKDLNIAVINAKNNVKKITDDINVLKNTIETTGLSIKKLLKDKKSKLNIYIILAVLGILIGFKIHLFLVVIPIAGYLSYKTNTEFTKKINEANENLLNEEKLLAQLNDQLNSENNTISNTEAEIERRAFSLPKIKLGEIGFPLQIKNILGISCILDPVGAFETKTLSGVDLTAVGDELKPIAEGALALANVPIMLKADSSNDIDSPVNRLYGEEDQFEKIVTGYTSVLGKVQDISISLPLIPQKSIIASTIENNSNVDDSASRNLHIVKGNAVDQESINKFVEEINIHALNGHRTLNSLNQTFEALNSTGQLYSQARSGSINHLHQNLFEVLNRASWCSKRFYCPRTIQSPKYIRDLLGVQPDSAHLIPLTELIDKLSADTVIEKRIKNKPELIEQLRISILNVNEFTPEAHEDSTGLNSKVEMRSIFIEDQYNEALKQFRISLNHIMFGSPLPALSISEESRLYYDPELEEWKSELIPHVYSTAQIQKYGQILKLRNDLLFPMWEHLWTEKADFRKSELFRTNESLIRMSEKEGEKLIEIGNQFRSDTRSVRENIYMLEPEAKSQLREINDYKIGINALGLLSERQNSLLSTGELNNLENISGSIIEDSEIKETLLGYEPKNQAMRRGTVSDPIDDSKNPSILLVYQDRASSRLAIQQGSN